MKKTSRVFSVYTGSGEGKPAAVAYSSEWGEVARQRDGGYGGLGGAGGGLGGGAALWGRRGRASALYKGGRGVVLGEGARRRRRCPSGTRAAALPCSGGRRAGGRVGRRLGFGPVGALATFLKIISLNLRKIIEK